MKQLSLFIIVLFGFQAFAQEKIEFDLAGYRFEQTIKGPKHKNSKVIEVMLDQNGNYIAASFAGPKSLITVNVYKLYSWEMIGTFQFKGRAELYNSYFDSEEDVFYVNTNIFKNQFKKIFLDTGEIEEIGCLQSPRGCEKLETEIPQTSLYTVGQNYYIARDDARRNYIKVYKKKGLFIDGQEYLDEGGTEEESTISFPDETTPNDSIQH